MLVFRVKVRVPQPAFWASIARSIPSKLRSHAIARVCVCVASRRDVIERSGRHWPTGMRRGPEEAHPGHSASVSWRTGCLPVRAQPIFCGNWFLQSLDWFLSPKTNFGAAERRPSRALGPLGGTESTTAPRKRSALNARG